MSPKEKAQELYKKMESDLFLEPRTSEEQPKLCALIAADEIVKVAYWPSVRGYWEEVKQELKKL
jgi:hypothetical protein